MPGDSNTFDSMQREPFVSTKPPTRPMAYLCYFRGAHPVRQARCIGLAYAPRSPERFIKFDKQNSEWWKSKRMHEVPRSPFSRKVPWETPWFWFEEVSWGLPFRCPCLPGLERWTVFRVMAGC